MCRGGLHRCSPTALAPTVHYGYTGDLCLCDATPVADDVAHVFFEAIAVDDEVLLLRLRIFLETADSSAGLEWRRDGCSAGTEFILQASVHRGEVFSAREDKASVYEKRREGGRQFILFLLFPVPSLSPCLFLRFVKVGKRL